MPPRFQIFASSSEARTATLQGLLIAALVITGLYVAREVLLPLVLAILLSFVLTPALLFLRRLKVPRVIGVAIVVASAFAVIFALGWLMSQQATQLAEAMPRYQHVLADKIAALAGSSERAGRAIRGPAVPGRAGPGQLGGGVGGFGLPPPPSRFWSRSTSHLGLRLSSIGVSLGPCCRRSPQLASSFSSSSSSYCSARICGTGQSV